MLVKALVKSGNKMNRLEKEKIKINEELLRLRQKASMLGSKLAYKDPGKVIHSELGKEECLVPAMEEYLTIKARIKGLEKLLRPNSFNRAKPTEKDILEKPSTGWPRTFKPVGCNLPYEEILTEEMLDNFDKKSHIQKETPNMKIINKIEDLDTKSTYPEDKKKARGETIPFVQVDESPFIRSDEIEKPDCLYR